MLQLVELLPTHPATAPLVREVAAAAAAEEGGGGGGGAGGGVGGGKKPQHARNAEAHIGGGGTDPSSGNGGSGAGDETDIGGSGTRGSAAPRRQQRQEHGGDWSRATAAGLPGAPAHGGQGLLLLCVAMVALAGFLYVRLPPRGAAGAAAGGGARPGSPLRSSSATARRMV